MTNRGDNENETLTFGYYCSDCTYHSVSFEDMRSHFSSHNKTNLPFTYIFLEDRKEPKFFEEPLYLCAKCDVFYTTDSLVFKEHWRVNHDIKETLDCWSIPNVKNDTFTCDICDKQFFNKFMCELHEKVELKTTYPLLKRSSTESLFPLYVFTKSFICFICSRDCTSFEDLEKHYGKKHFQEVVRYILILQDDTIDYIDYIYPNDRTYACVYCTLKFGRNKLDVISHYNDIHPDVIEPKVQVGYPVNGYSGRPESLNDFIGKEMIMKTLYTENQQFLMNNTA